MRAALALPLGRRRTAALSVACGLLALAALVSLLLLPDTIRGIPPTPPAPVAAAPHPSASGDPSAGRPAGGKPFRCQAAAGSGDSAQPVRICIPGIHVDASVMRLGLNRDRTVQVPPLSRVGDAGWYRYSARPGTVGPTVILGHVDSAQYGDGVFYRLGRLHRGDTVSVARSDGRTALYTIDRVQEIAKKHFPTQDVYGPTSGPAIRLVTCGGRFDSGTGSYEDNIIAFGTLHSLRGR